MFTIYIYTDIVVGLNAWDKLVLHRVYACRDKVARTT